MARKVKKEKTRRISILSRVLTRKVRIFLILILVFLLAAGILGFFLFPRLASHFVLEEMKIVYQDGTDADLNLKLYGIEKGRTSVLELMGGQLRRKSELICADHPELKTVEFGLEFPDRLNAVLEKRRAVAQVKLEGFLSRWEKFFLIDDEGVAFVERKEMTQEKLPVITGIKAKSGEVKLGVKWKSGQIRKALLALSEFNMSLPAKKYQIEKIEAGGREGVSLWLTGNLEVKLGGKDFKERILLLEQVLEQMKEENIKDLDIDLRFGDGIVRPK